MAASCLTTLSSPLPDQHTSLSPSNLINLTISSPSHLQQLHSLLIKSGAPISSLSFLRIAAVCALSPPSAFSYARNLFHRSANSPEIFLWNSHLNTLSSSSPSDALLLFTRLLSSNILPNTFSCSFALKACSQLSNCFLTGKNIHALILKLGFHPDVFLHNTLVHMYSSLGAMADAHLMFEKMPRRDTVSYNIMIARLTMDGEMDLAREMFDAMPERSVRSWTSLIAGYVQWQNPREAVRLFIEMENLGMRPNEVTVVAVLAACADLGALDLGKRIHEYANLFRFLSNVRICNTLIDMYIKCGCVQVAREVFDDMSERTVVSWSAMINGYAIHGQGDDALELFKDMRKVGIQPNPVTFVGLLHACSHMGLLKQGQNFFKTMIRDYNIVPEIEHYGCMVDLLSRAGLLDEALEFIRKMPVKPNGVVWGALLGGAKVYNRVDMAEEAVRQLFDLDPLNDGYYVVLSNIYANAGRFNDAAKVRRLMRNKGVKKTPGQSTIAVDGVIHEFVAGESDHPQVEEIYRSWDELLVKLKVRGYVPDTSVVLLDMEEREKEAVLYRHSEKLAVVFGLMSTPPGTVIRIIKNLRVCNDCHAALKLISEISKREIIVRDRNRFHCFRDGFCSCRDYW
ncbi:pentatricopeptide repeat-containing protein At5g66520-like [Phalaenopsis equestris]|uniref:pentatricopeptide repeat-containing protein At5g66520-like n=1 Tax=Phalaenopsis equestris TaxID=78828 RepID=UPI0009E4885F|nr:pentatricopeptide repeat-containing protein At5g66520-like [Phalaenopsis equestris]